jgi:glycerate dehydrogenase
MNVPSYSSSAVASLVLTFILNFSCSLIPQQRSLYRGDTTNFTTC